MDNHHMSQQVIEIPQDDDWQAARRGLSNGDTSSDENDTRSRCYVFGSVWCSQLLYLDGADEVLKRGC